MNKKGISQLLITVLIIGFAVALAAIIFIWGGGFTKDVTEQTSNIADDQIICMKDVDYKITTACYEGPTVKTTIENKGSVDIEDVVLRFYKGPQDVETHEKEDNIASIQIVTVNQDTASPEDITQIDAIALVKLPGWLSVKPCQGKVETYLDTLHETKLPAC